MPFITPSDASRISAESLVVEGAGGPQIFTLEGATQSYRVLVESMNEGAATVAEDGIALYCNRRFAGMLAEPLQKVMGSSVREHVAERSRAVSTACGRGRATPPRARRYSSAAPAAPSSPPTPP